ncbi:MAG: response regulator, partial [Pyrinomonadaceae bacterium]|nr:response regulator [Pyrinomonadaceae bacterium]
MSTERRRTLLVADDSPTVRKVVSLTFGDEGVEVLTAGSGREALEQLQTVVPDLVLADALMPEPDGYQLCEHIKNDERLRHVPVVLLVGTFEPFNEAEARKVGADDVLTKPFQSIRDLIKRVMALFSGGTAAETQEHAAAAGSLPNPIGGYARPNADAGSVHQQAAAAPMVSWEAAPPAESFQTAASNEPAYRYDDPVLDDPSIESRPVAESVHYYEEPARYDEPVQYEEPIRYEEPLRYDEPVVATWNAAPAEAVPVETVAPVAAADSWDVDVADDFEKDAAAPAAPPASAPVVPEVASAYAAAPMAAVPVVRAAKPAKSSFNARPASVTVVDDNPLLLPDFDVSDGSAASLEDDDFILDIGDAPPPSTKPAPPIAYSRKAAAKRVKANGKGMATKLAPAVTTTAAAAKPQLKGTACAITKVKEEMMKAGISTALNVNQMPNETLDAVARRVVEHLSDKVIREIAWEVVPDLAERLIK